MKRLLVLLSIMIFSLLAMAGDGPFPIASAVGTWKSESVNGLFVTITTGYRNNNSISVTIVVKNSIGNRIATGHTVHLMTDTVLRVPVVDDHSGQEIVEIKAVPARVLHEPPQSGYRLVMTIEKIGSPSNEVSIIFGRH